MCNKIYIIETLRTFKKCIDEHIRDFKLGDFFDAQVKHNLEPKRSFNFKDSKMLVEIHNNQQKDC